MKLRIGDRITISKEGLETVIRIDGMVEGWMNNALFGWVVMWTLMGVYVAFYLITGKTEGNQMFFFITYLMFWLYFEVKAIYSWLFRAKGYELIIIKPDAWYIKRAVFSYGKVVRYVFENIKDLRKVENDRKSIIAALNKSFWVIGNEQLTFEYFGKNVGIGMHLTEKDRSELLIYLRKTQKKNNRSN